jgi:hypothetical protein
MKIAFSSGVEEIESTPEYRAIESYNGTGWIVSINGNSGAIVGVRACVRGDMRTAMVFLDTEPARENEGSILGFDLNEIETFHVH